MSELSELYEISPNCLSRCPRVAILQAAYKAGETTIKKIEDHAFGEDIEEFGKTLKSIYEARGLPALGVDEINVLLRQGSAAWLEFIASINEELGERAEKLSDGCNAPLEAYGTDAAGRTIGAFVCMSSCAARGQSLEPANVFRY